ncbi:MAG TPA: glycosyltransferase family 4 protein [Chthoniobacterales bacterium]|jgi:glycosyltransferase involved in cell wall biosynthesis|nr:glycosyltransferase family 4 protein [Chthoniobacterales bacterium]
MPGLAYLFERFPSFTQTFCYREIVELRRQGLAVATFSVRRPRNEPAQDWDPAIVREIEYLPRDEQLVAEVDGALRKGELPARAADEIAAWGRKTDFLRLYQAAWLGPRLGTLGVRHLHAHFAGLAARTAWWLKRFFGIGFSFTAHANDIFAPKPFEISLGALVQSASAVVTVSDFGTQFLRGKFPEAADRIHRVYNGIALDCFERADLNQTPPAIISIGRLIEKKGFGDLIEACRLLGERGLDFRCQIIGEGPLETLLREQIARAGLTNRVALTGPLAQAEVIRRLARSTVFALPCVAEPGGGMDNLPTVVMEAMAAGLPVVATPIAGLPEMVEEGGSGFLVPENQPATLAEALGRLCRDRDLGRSLGKAGRERAFELFRIEASARQLRAIFARSGA